MELDQRLPAPEIAPAIQQGSQEESWLDKARREVRLVGVGLGGFTDAAKEAIAEHPFQTAGNVAIGMGVGFGLAYLSRGRGLALTAARTIGAVSGLAFLKDVASNGGEIFNAMHDNWHSDRHWGENARSMREHLGQFAFDTVLLSAAGAAGSKIGHSMFSMKLSDLPHELVPQMNDKGISQDYYNKLIMADHYANVATNTEGKYSAQKVARAQQSLQESLQGMVTYRDYWNNEMASYRSDGTRPLDTKAAMNVLLNGNGEARALNRLTVQLRDYGNSDVTDPQILGNITQRLQSARQIIYGAKKDG